MVKAYQNLSDLLELLDEHEVPVLEVQDADLDPSDNIFDVKL